MPTVTQTDIQAIQNYAGTFDKKIITQIVNGLDVAQDVYLRRNLTAPVNLPKFSASDGFRPVDTSIDEPDGQNGTMGIRKLIPRTGMKILKIVPEDLRGTYLSDGLDPNAKELPVGFAPYFWDAQVKKIQAEINNNCFYAVDSFDIVAFNAATAYNVGDRFSYKKSFYQVKTATNAGETPETAAVKFKNINNSSVAKGLGTIIVEEYASLPVRNKIATGTFDVTNTFDKVTNFYMSLPEEIRPLGGEIKCSQGVYDKYMLSALAKFTNGTSILQVPGQPGVSIYGSDGKWKLKPCTWMSGSSRLIATHDREVLQMGTDQTSAFTSIGNIIPFLHGYKAIMKMILSFQISDLEVLFVNDQL